MCRKCLSVYTDGIRPDYPLLHFSDKCSNNVHTGRCEDESCEDGSHFKPCLKTAKKWIMTIGGDFDPNRECWSLCGRCYKKAGSLSCLKRYEFNSLKEAEASESIHEVLES